MWIPGTSTPSGATGATAVSRSVGEVGEGMPPERLDVFLGRQLTKDAISIIQNSNGDLNINIHENLTFKYCDLMGFNYMEFVV